MTLLARRSLVVLVRSRALVPPLLTALLVLLLVADGGPQDPRATYADAAVLLLPLQAWLVARLADGTPDLQRELDVLAAGASRQALATTVAGLVAAGALVPVALLVLLPSLRDPGAGDLLRGLAVLLLLLPVAVVLGLLAARPVVRTPAGSAAVLVGGGVVLLLLSRSPAALLAPPLLPVLRDGHGTTAPDLPLLAVHALAWATVVLTGYAAWRRRVP